MVKLKLGSKLPPVFMLLISVLYHFSLLEKCISYLCFQFAFLFQQIQVLDVQETIDRQQGKEYEHDLSETEKAIVREMCNVSLMCFIVYSVLKASS